MLTKTGETREIQIPGRGFQLEGTLILPAEPFGLVIFAHGSGSSRFSTRNRFVAEVLHAAGLGTLLFDLLTEAEAEDQRNVFDIQLLADRLQLASDWIGTYPDTCDLRLGYFGASTGAAAALLAAAARPEMVGAVVSRGGRPDLAERALGKVRAPTLLLVGGADELVLHLNRRAYFQLHCPKDLIVINGATHLFEESGALEEVANHAAKWFHTYLLAAARARIPTERTPSRLPAEPAGMGGQNW
jgi:putative phosphoribosyl transferase